MELSPEEQSFFDAGDELDDPAAPERARHRHRSRRHSRRHNLSAFRHRLANRGWRKLSLSLVLMIAAVIAGYWLSMFVANRDLPAPSDFGAETRGR
jgi:hypothetical protein